MTVSGKPAKVAKTSSPSAAAASSGGAALAGAGGVAGPCAPALALATAAEGSAGGSSTHLSVAGAAVSTSPLVGGESYRPLQGALAGAAAGAAVGLGGAVPPISTEAEAVAGAAVESPAGGSQLRGDAPSTQSSGAESAPTRAEFPSADDEPDLGPDLVLDALGNELELDPVVVHRLWLPTGETFDVSLPDYANVSLRGFSMLYRQDLWTYGGVGCPRVTGMRVRPASTILPWGQVEAMYHGGLSRQHVETVFAFSVLHSHGGVYAPMSMMSLGVPFPFERVKDEGVCCFFEEPARQGSVNVKSTNLLMAPRGAAAFKDIASSLLAWWADPVAMDRWRRGVPERPEDIPQYNKWYGVTAIIGDACKRAGARAYHTFEPIVAYPVPKDFTEQWDGSIRVNAIGYPTHTIPSKVDIRKQSCCMEVWPGVAGAALTDKLLQLAMELQQERFPPPFSEPTYARAGAATADLYRRVVELTPSLLPHVTQWLSSTDRALTVLRRFLMAARQLQTPGFESVVARASTSCVAAAMLLWSVQLETDEECAFGSGRNAAWKTLLVSHFDVSSQAAERMLCRLVPLLVHRHPESGLPMR